MTTLQQVHVGAQLQRATLRTSRLMDFCSRKELTAQTRPLPGPPTGRWLPRRITKIDHQNIEKAINND
jgi:hypothetical protein